MKGGPSSFRASTRSSHASCPHFPGVHSPPAAGGLLPHSRAASSAGYHIRDRKIASATGPPSGAVKIRPGHGPAAAFLAEARTRRELADREQAEIALQQVACNLDKIIAALPPRGLPGDLDGFLDRVPGHQGRQHAQGDPVTQTVLGHTASLRHNPRSCRQPARTARSDTPDKPRSIYAKWH